MLIIGSTALSITNVSWSKPNDLDMIMTQNEFDQFIHNNSVDIVLTKQVKEDVFNIFMIGSDPIEIEIARNGNSAEKLLEIVFDEYRPLYSTINTQYYASPIVCYALKLSHRFKRNSPQFKKTMDDIIKLRTNFLVEETLSDLPKLASWIKIREKETYNYSHPKLNRTKGEFFSNDGVNYIYDHDSIHESVKLFDRPAFELIKQDKADVFCSKSRFFNEITEDVRLATVLEEAYTLALERHQIPNDFRPDSKKSFLIALEKICTSIASGWWREFAYENYYKIIDRFNSEYVNKFQVALAEGLIKPYKE